MIDADSQKILDKVHAFARENFIMILADECEVVLRNLFEKYSPKRVLEIGTAIGYSSSVMALSSDCTIDTVEKDRDRTEKAKELWRTLGIDGRVNCFEGDSNELLPNVVKGKTYDFVFIDGAKSSYKSQLEFLYPYIEKGGIVLCDDVLYFGLVRGEEKVKHKQRTIVKNLRVFLDYIQNSELFETEIIEEGNGIAVVRKK